MSLSFTVTVTSCGECPHADHYLSLCFFGTASPDDMDAVRMFFTNKDALTATGPYACPMLKQQMKQDDDEPNCPIHGKTDGGDCPRC